MTTNPNLGNHRRKHAQLISWNVNGIRSIVKKGFVTFVEDHQPDIICLQEIKARPEQVELELSDYFHYWNPAERAGYSGTAIFTKFKPQKVIMGLDSHLDDREGRVLTLEYPGCYLVTVYTPNSQRELTRLNYRTEEWDRCFRDFLSELRLKKPVVFCGDLNVAHKEIDLANPKTNRKSAGFTDEERHSFDNYLGDGFIDSFRAFNQESGHYTWWSYRPGIRERNIGWRIDYFCISDELRSKMASSDILSDVLGSDHCPIRLKILRELFKG